MCDLLLTTVQFPPLTTSCIKPPPPTGDHLLETPFKVKLLQLEPLINDHLSQEAVTMFTDNGFKIFHCFYPLLNDHLTLGLTSTNT